MSQYSLDIDSDPQTQVSIDDQYQFEHHRDISVEEYFQNIDQRLNLKVAKGIKQAMSLVLNKIDFLIDQKLASRLELEDQKQAAQQQRIMNHVQQLIQAELSLKITELDIKQDNQFQLRKDKLSPLSTQPNCVQIGVQQGKSLSNTVSQNKFKSRLNLPPRQSDLQRTSTITNNKITKRESIKEDQFALKSILKPPKGKSSQGFLQIQIQSEYNSTQGTSPRLNSMGNASPSSSYRLRRNELKLAKAENPQNSRTKTSEIGKNQPTMSLQKKPINVNKIPQFEKQQKFGTNERANTSSDLNLNRKQEDLGQMTPKSILKNKNPDGSSKLTPRQQQHRPLYGPPPSSSKSKFSLRDSQISQKNSRSSIIQNQVQRSLSIISKQSSVRDTIPIGHELVKKQLDQGDKKKLKWSGDFKPKSTFKDIVDDIYRQDDPIGVSIQSRKDRGAVVTTVLRDTYSHNGRFYFTLRVKPPLQTTNDIMSETLTESNQKPSEQRDSLMQQDIQTEQYINQDFSFSICDTPKESLEEKLKALKQSIVDIGVDDFPDSQDLSPRHK